jgi:muramoyltetrapeptide carboxypeptidase
MRFIEDPEVNAILALRGGYGCSRLIPRLDEKRLRSHCKPFIGFSDLTTLHLYFKRRLGWVTFHGPMVASPNFPSAVSGQGNHLRSLLCDPNYLPCLRFQEMQVIAPGVADGKLVGGCLSLVVASLGTPYEIRTEGKILFLEDLGEPPYRIDRMLMQLKLAGKLQETAGVLLGTFKECEPGNPDYTLLDVFQEILQPLGVPVLYGFPAGHGQENWAIPLGVGVRLDADNKSVEFLEPAVLGRNQDHDA